MRSAMEVLKGSSRWWLFEIAGERVEIGPIDKLGAPSKCCVPRVAKFVGVLRPERDHATAVEMMT